MLSHVCVFVKDFLKKLLRLFFVWFYVLLTLNIVSHVCVIVNSKSQKYDKIIIQTLVRLCATLIVQDDFIKHLFDHGKI